MDNNLLNKKALLICEYFNPFNNMAAKRGTSIAKELIKRGYEVDVLTLNNDFRLKKNKQLLLEGLNLNIVNIKGLFGKITKQIIEKNAERVGKTAIVNIESNTGKKEHINVKQLIIDKLKPLYYSLAPAIINYNFYRQGLKLVRKLLKDNNYEFVFSTYGEFAPHKIATFIKKRRNDIFWVADFRDEINKNTARLRIQEKSFENYASKYCKKADLITAVSQGVLDNTKLPDSIEKIILTNGYNKSDLYQERFEENEVMTIVYAGSFYSDRTLKPFFKAINSMDKKYDSLQIEIQYYGNSYNDFINDNNFNYINKYIHNYGMVSRQESLKAQSKADMLLLTTWNKSGATGILTGKFPEYVGSRKPILGFVSGNLPNSLLKEEVSKMNIGFTYEEAIDNQKEQEDYLIMQYEYFLKEHKCLYEGNVEFTSKYDYENIVDSLLAKINQ